MVKNCRNQGTGLGLVVRAIAGVIPLGIASLHAVPGNRALAQGVTSDDSLNTQVTPIGNIYEIRDGTPVLRSDGSINLFHSFKSFSVPMGWTAQFLNDANNVANIFGRVTGGTASDIQGIIKANGTANLFLINPSGIIFGRDAQLDIGGSFVGTTANAIGFPGGEFSMTSPVTPDNTVLAVNPSALFFNQTPAGAIVNQSTVGLQVNPDESLFLVGGEVQLNGGTVRAPGGRIELGGLAGAGTIEIEEITEGSNPNRDLPKVRLKFPDDAARTDVTLANGAVVDVVYDNGGDIAINARNITISGQTTNVCAGIGTTDSSCDTPGFAVGGVASKAGNILFNATGAVNISQSRIENNVNPGATGNSEDIFTSVLARSNLFGSIIINAESFSLTDRAQLSTSTFGKGSSGLVFVQAEGQVSVDNSNVFSQVLPGAEGDAGGILILGESISLNNATLEARTRSIGDAGLVALEAEGGTVNLTNSTLFSNVESGATGNAGGIAIEAGSISLNNSALRNEINAAGNGGSVELQTNGGTISFDNSFIFSTVESGGSGTGGEIEIETGSLSVTNGSELQTLIRGNGDAGLISIKADGDVSLTNRGRIYSTVEQGASGNAGLIVLEVGSLSIKGDGNVDQASGLTTSIQGVGNPGYILVKAEENVSLEGAGSGIVSASSPQSVNIGDRTGGILIDTNSLFIRDGAAVSVENQSSGEAGRIFVLADEDIILRDQGQIRALATSGQGGNIFLTSGDFLVLVSDSQVNTEAFNPNNSNANGGNIFVVTRYLIAAPFNTNDIVANAVQGSGGNITVFASRLYDIEKRPEVFPTNDISVSSDFGVDGTVTSNVLNVDPTQGLANLPADPVDPSTLIGEACAPRGGIAERQKNQFINTGRGGLPPDPNAAFPGEAVVNDLGTSEEGEENTTGDPNSTNPTSPAPVATASPQKPEMVEAQGWVYGENGDIVFTAQSSNTTVAPNNPSLTPASTCNVSSTLPQ